MSELIQDREADIFAFFAAPRREGLDLLVRATQPRRIAVTDAVQSHTLLKAVAEASVIATQTVKLPARPGQKARQAHLTVRVLAVSLLAPHNATAPPGVSVRGAGIGRDPTSRRQRAD